ncbi:MAG: hypothetical protein ABSD70_13945 [Terracidiphilus sp.]
MAESSAAHRPDQEIARRITNLELSERLTESTLNRIVSDFAPGAQTKAALQLLADQSAFLDPPPSELPSIPPPDVSAQQRMLDAARSYVAQTLTSLPNFLATRTTNRFDDSPQRLTENAWPIRAGLHFLGTSSREISVRDDQGVMSSAAERVVKGKEAQAELTSWGEFGPILGMLMEDTANGTVSWSHWEKSAAAPVAVFSYSVPRPFSHFQLNGFVPQLFGQFDSSGGVLEVKPGLDAPKTTPYHITPGYHGELWLDPATGTILRITIEADLKGRDTAGAAPILQLNETLFTNYHRFASTARVLTDAQQRPGPPLPDTLVAYDAGGKRVNFTDQGTIFNLKPEGYARMLDTNTNISHRIVLDLPAGQILLRVVVYDPVTVRVGSLEVPVRVAAK